MLSLAPSFGRADAWQREARDKLLVPFYRRRFPKGFWFQDDLFSQSRAIDTVGRNTDGSLTLIEEKIVQWPGRPYSALCLETGDDRQQPTWVRYGLSDWLLWLFIQADASGVAYVFDFQKLKTWFWPRIETFPSFGPLGMPPHTYGRVVSLKAIALGGVPHRIFHLTSSEG